ncbi:MAG TPA: helix-turn-helix domain-containing protein [Solirubrobacterales bacterium]|nr:helix-turn-helix domain-containing protein [Solirubrobacterales bacterium]
METITKAGQKRSVEEAVSYAIGHRIRIEILALLNEATHSPSELAKLISQPITTVSHHIKELVNSGCIELARIEKVRNADQHFYRAVELPFVSDEEAESLPVEARQQYAAVILQALMAEGLAALWAGKMTSDPVWMSWRWFNLDAQGQQDAQEAQHEFWQRIKEIDAETANRVALSGEKTTSTIIAALGFERFKPVGNPAPAVHRLTPGKN